jgi:PleD family two-component response regulator
VSRILLADDSPHAQRMGERILREEGFEVVTVTDGNTAMIRLPDVDPDVILADVLLPNRSGYDICSFVKSHPVHQHTRVVLIAGLLEPVDEAEAERVRADGILKKPFEASAMIAAVRPLAEAAQLARGIRPESPRPEPKPKARAQAAAAAAPAPLPEPDRELVRAAVVLALDQAMPAMVEEITNRVMIALKQ